MTNEWLDDATARRAAYEWTEAKDEETGLRLMREVLPPLVRVRELRAVEVERDQLRKKVEELAEDATARVASNAKVTAEAVRRLAEKDRTLEHLRGLFADEALRMQRELAEVEAERNKLRARVAELEASRPAPAAVAAEGERHRIQSIDGKPVPFTVDVLRREVEENPEPKPLRLSVADQASLLADIDARAPVESDAGLTDAVVAEVTCAWYDGYGPVTNTDIRDMRRAIAKLDELRPLGARLRMPTEIESEVLRMNLRDAWEDAKVGEEGPATLRVVASFLRTLGAEIVEDEASFDPKKPDTWTPQQAAEFNAAKVYAYNPTTGVARSKVQVESKEIEARAVSPGDEVYVSGAWQRVRSVSNISSDRTMMDLDRGNGSRWGCVRRSHDLVLARSREQVQAAAGEPDYWTRLEHQYVAMHWTENAADELFAEARRMSTEARRRVEGEEACK